MKFELKPLDVPTHVFVNLFNDRDYQPIPLANITDEQFHALVNAFVNSIYKTANKQLPPKEV